MDSSYETLINILRFIRTLSRIIILPILLPHRIAERMVREILREIYKIVLVKLDFKIPEDELKKYSSLNRLTKTISNEFIEITSDTLELNVSDIKLGVQRLFELLVSSKLVKTTNTLIAKSIQEKKQEDVVKNTIVGMLILEKSKPIARSYLVLMLSLVIYVSICQFTEMNLDITPITLMIFLGMSVYANQWVLEYRIRKGFYGNNRYEASEIVEFIENKIKNDDFTDGSGGPKELYPDAEREAKNSGVIVSGVPEVS